MNKWEESLTNSNDKRKLLIESSEFTSKIKLNKTLKESLVMQSGKNGTLIVRNIPVTILDRENLNGRIYSTETMRQAIEEAREAMRDKQTLGQANEHPESSFVAPTDASHVIINAYIKENINIVVDGKKERHNVLFTDWEVLNTTHGKDLRALFEAECSFGTSIRGVGELNGKMVENYSFISVDGVGNPSSSTYTRMPVSESVKVEFKDANELKENYTVTSSSTNVVRDLSQAGILQQQLNANPYGTVTKTSTKVDQETDPKTGAQTSITTVEADTEDEVNNLAQAFDMAHKAMTNGVAKVTSVTIEANEDEDEHGNKTESTETFDTGIEAYAPESAPVEENVEDIINRKFGDIQSKLPEDNIYSIRAKKVMDNYKNGKLTQRDVLASLEIPSKFANDYVTKHGVNEDVDDDIEHMKAARENEQYIRAMGIKRDIDAIIQDKTASKEIRKKFVELDSDINHSLRHSDSFSEIDEQLDKAVDAIYDYYNGINESTIVESKKEEQKDPNEGKQYVLKIKDNDPEIKEGAESEPEFVAMKGNAIRFTKDPKKALHFTKGMENSGIVHYDNIQKLLADMGYGEQNLEKWYKKDGEVAPKKEGSVGGVIKGTVSNCSLGSDIDNNLTNEKDESTELTEDGNTKYSLILEINNKGGLSETKPFSVSAVDQEAVLKEISNQWDQQDRSSDGRQVVKATLVNNQTGERFIYDRKGNTLTPEQDNEQQVQSVEEPVDNDVKFSDPKDVNLGVAAESADGEIEQKDNKLSMDIDDNTHVEKEFETPAQASVAKAAVEQGKVSGDVLLSDAVDDDNNWKICVVFDKLDYDDEELLYNNADSDSGQHVFSGFSDGKPDKIRVTLYPQEVGNADNWAEIFSLARNKLKNNLGVSGHPHVADFDVFDSNEQFKDGIQELPESTNELKPGWYVAHDKIGISGPYETREACMEGLEDFAEDVSVYEITEDDLNEVLFKEPSKPSDEYIQEPEEESVVESSLVPVRFSNIKWDEKDVAYRMFEDIEKDMQVSHIEPDINNANILVEYFENYMNDLNNVSVSYNVNPTSIKESNNYQEEIIKMYNEDESRKYPKIQSADINLG